MPQVPEGSNHHRGTSSSYIDFVGFDPMNHSFGWGFEYEKFISKPMVCMEGKRSFWKRPSREVFFVQAIDPWF